MYKRWCSPFIAVHACMQVSIIKHFKLLIDEEDKLPPLIPETVVLQHYVHFRLALRRYNVM